MLSAASGSGGRGGGVPSSVSNKNRKKAKQESLEGHEAEYAGTEPNNYNFDQNCNHYDKTKQEESR